MSVTFMPFTPRPNDDLPATLGDVRRAFGSVVHEPVTGPHFTLDWATSNAKRITISVPCQIEFANAQAGGAYILELEHDHEGASIEWAIPVFWSPVNRPPASTARGFRNILTFYFDGTAYVGVEYARGIPRSGQL